MPIGIRGFCLHIAVFGNPVNVFGKPVNVSLGGCLPRGREEVEDPVFTPLGGRLLLDSYSVFVPPCVTAVARGRPRSSARSAGGRLHLNAHP